MDQKLQEDVSKAVHNTYPQLFDYNIPDEQLNSFIQQADIKCRKYNVNRDELILLMQLYTAFLIQSNQETDGVATSIKADVLQVSMSDSNLGSNYYLNQFNDMISSLDLDGWSFQAF